MPPVPEDKKPITAYTPHSFPEHFEQDLPGSDKHMSPHAEHTKLECWDDKGQPYLKEYQGTGMLEGKNAIITGGDSGIGRSTAIMMAREGADVTITFLPPERHDAEDTKKMIEPTGRKVVLVELDQKDEESCKNTIKKHVDTFGRIDILVNNAAKQEKASDLKAVPMAQIRNTFEINIIGMIQMTKYALPHMKRGSAVINSTSVVAYKGSAKWLDYASTKGAIVAFTRSLATQLAKDGIRVNAVAPGPVYTPLQPGARSAEEMENWGVNKVPLRGRVAQPAELGPTYVYLAGPPSNYMTGATIHVNGGIFVSS